MKIAIVGGYGKMGRWCAAFMLKAGFKVLLIGRSEQKLLDAKKEIGDIETSSRLESVKSAEVILLSVPIDNFEEVVKELGPHVSPGKTVIDITSIKEIPVKLMHKYLKATTLGVHPMFGPGARDASGQNFVLTPTNKNEKALSEKVRQYLEAQGAQVTVLTPQKHDELMAVVLGLSQLLALVSADTLLAIDEPGKTREVSGSTYKLLLTLAKSVVSENPQFCASLQMNLPVLKVGECFREKLASWIELVANKDRQAFIRKIDELRCKFEETEPDFERAYQDMYKLVGGL